jgi:biopolymer transport protein ExbB
MNAKNLTIAAAIVLSLGLGLGAAQAQTAPATDTSATTATTGTTAAPADTGAATATGGDLATSTATTAPSPAESTATTGSAATPAATTESAYSLGQMWAQGDWVARGTLILLILMSAGSWYIAIMKYIEQSNLLGQAKITEKRFWSAANLEEGIERLGKTNVFRTFAERGQQAMARQSGGIAGGLTEADWLGMSMQRAIDDENLRLQSGIAFLASVGSTAPFVGLFGTVWGVLHALINIGVAGQFSIDKVAGPVGESLIMTAIGLAVAVPAVLSYNLLVRRNKVIHEKLRAFAGDLQTYLLTSKR